METSKYRLCCTILSIAAVVDVGCNENTPASAPVPVKTVSTTAGEETDHSPVAARKPQPAGDETAYADDKVGISFPRKLGGLTYVDRYVYPERGFGYSLRYDNADSIEAASDFMKIDAYVYDAGFAIIQEGHDDPAMIEAIAQAEAGIRYYEQQGNYHNVKKLAEGVYPKKLDEDAIGFRFSQFEFSQPVTPGEGPLIERVSETYIRGFNNHFIKLRVTYPKSASESSVGIRDRVMAEFSELMQQE